MLSFLVSGKQVKSYEKQVRAMLAKNPGGELPYDAIETWERLGPLSLDKIVERSTRPVHFDLKESEYREVTYPDGSRVCG